MIVKMQKLTLLCMESEKDDALSALRGLGVLHIAFMKPPEDKDLDAVRARLARVERVLDAIPAPKKAKAIEERIPDEKPEAIVEKAGALIESRKEFAGEMERLLQYAEKAEPLGDFEPERISRLAENGISIGLFRAPDRTALNAPDGTALEVLSREKGNVYFAVAGPENKIGKIPDSWEELAIPPMSLSRAREQIAEKKQQIASAEADLAALAGHRPAMERLAADIRRKANFLFARAGMGKSGAIAYIRGFCPDPELARVRAAAAEHGWGLLIEKPGPEDTVPTLLRHPSWVKPIKALFETINVLPGYREVDISAAFLVFFSLFFGMIIGDAGYGLLFLILTIMARRKMKKAPGYPFTLLGILSVCTIIWGALTGNYFGIASAPGPLKALSIEWLEDNTNIMKLCFLIGAVHLTLAHAWNALRFINTPRALAQAGWILMTWTMFLAARFFVCGDPFPLPGGLILGGLGLVLVALFMTPVNRLKSEFIHHAMLPLSVINNFVDVVSYVRLFAVGMASVQVAQSFNTMALQLEIGRIWTAPIIALILLAGHGLNILLCALGVLVHGVRLNTLEFSNHIGLEWSGLKYAPFGKEEVDA